MSDIVFLRAWYPIKPRKYYNPVTNLLLKIEERQNWQGMRLVRDIRRDEGLAVPQNEDSRYRPIAERPETRQFNQLHIPKKLQADLPFASRPKMIKKRSSNQPTYIQRRAVVLQPEEKQIYSMMQQINTIRREKELKRKAKDLEKKMEYSRKRAKEFDIKEAKVKETQKGFYRKLGKAEAVKKKAGLSGAAFASSGPQ